VARQKNEVALAARAAMLRARSGASILHCDHGACGRSSLYDCAAFKLTAQHRSETFYRDDIEIQEPLRQAGSDAEEIRYVLAAGARGRLARR